MRTWLEIDSARLRDNIFHIVCMARTAMCGIVLKGNAYGHGLSVIASILKDDNRIVWFLVGTIADAVQLRLWGNVKPILVLTSDCDGMVDAIMYDITLTVCDMQGVDQVVMSARHAQKVAQIQIKVNVGLHRLGVDHAVFSALFSYAISHPEIQVVGVFGHMSDADDQEYTIECSQLFERVTALVPVTCMRHLVASGSLWMNNVYDLVRVGTLAYGSWKSEIHRIRLQALYPQLDIRPVVSWYTHIMHITLVAVGEYIGYGRTYRAACPMRIAVLPIGYADGYPRLFSNCGTVILHAQRAPVVGIISMNLMTVDVTHIAGVVVGDRVLLMGDYDGIRPYDLARIAHTNPNEITARISDAIPRTVRMDRV